MSNLLPAKSVPSQAQPPFFRLVFASQTQLALRRTLNYNQAKLKYTLSLFSPAISSGELCTPKLNILTVIKDLTTPSLCFSPTTDTLVYVYDKAFFVLSGELDSKMAKTQILEVLKIKTSKIRYLSNIRNVRKSSFFHPF